MDTDPTNAENAKRVVLDFFDLAFVNRKPEQARDRYLGATYKQHNPAAPDGAEIFPASSAASSPRRRKRRST